MNEHLDPGHYSDALVILAAAGIVIPTFARFRITPIIGFILVGILVGPYGLARFAGEWPWLKYLSIADPAAIAPIAELGVILLLFSIGLELSFGRLWRMRKRLVGFGGAELLGSAAIIAFALFMAGNSFNAALGLGLALALSSTALVLPIAGPGTPVGKLALAMLLFEDIALVPIIFLLGALAAPAGADGLDHLGTVLGQGALLIVVMMALGWFLLPSLFAQAARTKSPELFLSASLLIAIVASLATMAVGLSPIVGALLAGLLIAETPYAHEVEAVTLPFKGLALGVFLITVGMSLNLDLLAANWFKMLLATATVVFIKSVVTMALLRAGRVQRGLAAETSVLMASPSETTLIVLGAAAAGGLINQNAANFWQVVTAIGMTITPLLARIGHNIARRLDLREAAAKPAPPVPEEKHAILIGYGRVGQMVADMLETHNQPYLVLEADVDQADMGVRAGRPVRFGDASRTRTIEALHPERASAVVLTMDDPVQNVRLTRWLRDHYPDLTIVARARDVDHAAELYRAGASDAVPDTLESSLQLSESVLVDLGVAVGPVIASVHEVRDVLRRRIKEDADLDDAPRLAPVGRLRDA